MTKIGQNLVPMDKVATLNQATPTQNTYYDILPETKNCEVWAVAVNVEDTNETLQLRAIIDGETYTSTAIACTHSTNYFGYASVRGVQRDRVFELQTGDTKGLYPNFKGRTVQISVKKTTATGTGNLTGVVAYRKY